VTVSVIIPTYNSAAFVSEALDSILSQTCPVTEIIVVDDGSTDSTREIVSGYHEVQCIEKNHEGPSAARNAGIRQAKSKYVAFLDSDDLWLPDKIEKQMMAFAAYPDAGWSFSTLWFFGAGGNAEVPSDPFRPKALRAWLDTRRIREGVAFGRVYRLLLRANCVNTSSVVVCRDALIDAGLFDPAMTHGEDHDLWLRLARRWPAAFIVDPNSRVRIHSSELSGAWNSRQDLFYRSSIEILTKHRRAFPSVAAAKALATAYNGYALLRLKEQQWGEAKRLAAMGLITMPTPTGLRLWIEAAFPKTYSHAVGLLRGDRNP
jgi:glycosyltransferase involved in cell wall biosynthesis